MNKIGLAAALLPFLVSSPALAQSATVSDPVGDFLPSYTGVMSPDLDVTSFSVSLNPAATTFSIGAVLAGDINPALPGLYVIGVNTGTGTSHPFGAVGEGNVAFNQVILLQKNGTATVGGNPLTALISGNQFIVSVPVSLLPSTGAMPQDYGFNLWPRDPTQTGLAQLSDFAPQNSLLSVHGILPVPEPASWMMMLVGFGMVGGAVRFSQRRRRPIAQLA